MPVVELKKIFSVLDTNGDGVISAEEIKKAVDENEDEKTGFYENFNPFYAFTGGASVVGVFKLLQGAAAQGAGGLSLCF